MGKTKLTARYLLKLTVACTVACLCVLGYLLATGHGFIWKPDGTALYYTFFVAYGEMLRSGLQTLLSGQIPQIPAFTYSMGYGADLGLTLGSNITSPLVLLSIFFVPETAEWGYYLVAWLRVVLSGLAFSLYCFNRGKDGAATLVGSICYVLCGFMLFWGILRHPIFLSISVLLPLVLMGADKVFAGERPWWFILSVALTLLVQEYFAYIICMLLLGYCVVKYFFALRDRSVRDFVLLVGRFVLLLVLAFALSFLVTLPAVDQMMSMDRVTQDTAVPLLHMPAYYLSAIPNALGLYVATRGLYIGVVPLTLLCVFLWCRNRFDSAERRPWTVALICVTVMACIPWFGSAINGFGYVSDRWMVMLGFVLAYVGVLVVHVLGSLEATEWKRIGVTMGILLVLGTAATLYERGIAALIMAVPLAVVAVLTVWAGAKAGDKISLALVALTIAGAAIASIIYLCPYGDDTDGEFIGWGKAYEMVNVNTPSQAVLATGDDDGLYRYSVPGINSNISNDPLIVNMMGIIFYSSMYSQTVDDLRDDLGLWSNHKNYLFAGNDGRLAVEALSGVRYFVATQKQEWQVPYTYKDTGVEHAGFKVYKGEHALPLAFVQENAMAASDYDALSLVSRQEALLQACVLKDEDAGSNTVEPVTASQQIAYEAECDSGIWLGDDAIMVSDPHAHVKLRFQGLPQSETYLCFENLHIEYMGPIQAMRLKGDESEPSLKVRVQDALYTGISRFSVDASVGDRSHSFDVNTPKSTAYVSRANWSLNFGYADDAVTEMEISFSEPGIYHFDSMTVECQPVQPVVEVLDTIRSKGAAELSFETDRITARFEDAGEGAYGIVTVPYSTGWSATVDGKEVPVLRADVAFMAVDLGKAGDHEVVFTYETPGRALGAIVSLVGVVASIALLLAYRRREKYSKQPE